MHPLRGSRCLRCEDEGSLGCEQDRASEGADGARGQTETDTMERQMIRGSEGGSYCTGDMCPTSSCIPDGKKPNGRKGPRSKKLEPDQTSRHRSQARAAAALAIPWIQTLRRRSIWSTPTYPHKNTLKTHSVPGSCSAGQTPHHRHPRHPPCPSRHRLLHPQ